MQLKQKRNKRYENATGFIVLWHIYFLWFYFRFDKFICRLGDAKFGFVERSFMAGAYMIVTLYPLYLGI